MGVLTPPGDDPSLTSKPKEKQFQVVPVPAVFSRGRWKCCDFREAQLADNGMIEFVKPSKHPVDITQNASTIIVTNVAPNQLKALQKQQHLLEDEGKLPEPAMVAAPILADNNLGGGSELSHFDFPPASAGATMTTQDATNLVNDLRVPEAAAAELHHSASSATINIPVTTAATTKPIDATDISAIDSKIEQAMDLVKSHVTFAVRQEVEELKTTITALQNQVRSLQTENDYLKRFTPPDILANLPNLILNKMPYHKAESIVSEQQSSSRNLSPAPSELDEPPITIAAHHSLPPVSHSTRPALRIPAVQSVAMMMDSGAGAVPPTPPAANFPNMGIYEPGTPGLPRSASAIETTQIQSINENVQEDHTRQMTPPQQLQQQQQQQPLHPSHSTSHMVRHQYQHQSYPQTPQTPQPLTYPQQPPLHTYMPLPQMMHQQQQPQQSVPTQAAFIRQMSPPMTVPMNPHEQRHFSPPVVMNQQELTYPGHIQQQYQQQQQLHDYQQATNPFSPTSQAQPNIFQQHYPSHPQQQQQHQQMIQQQQNFQNIPVESQQQQQMPVHPSHQQHQQQQYYQQQQQPQ